MTFNSVIKRLEKLASDNSPLILTAIGVTGTITTAVLTGRAAFKAAEILHDDELTSPNVYEQTVKTKVALTWKLYIPAIGTGVLTVTCIVLANHIGTRRAAALAAAYSVSERAFAEYKDKVVEKLGEKKELAVRDEIAQDRVNNNPIGSREVVITGNGDVLCYDSISGRYFQSNVEALRKAQNDINAVILSDMYASLYDFYDIIGIPTTPYSNEVGWNVDTLLNLSFSTVMSTDGRPCVSLDYTVYPIRDYNRLQ